MDETPIPTPPLSTWEIELMDQLSSADPEAIDAEAFSFTYSRWRKVAMIVSRSLGSLEERYPEFTEVFYAERVRALVDSGKLESQGNLAYMRFSEVRRVNET